MFEHVPVYMGCDLWLIIMRLWKFVFVRCSSFIALTLINIQNLFLNMLLMSTEQYAFFHDTESNEKASQKETIFTLTFMSHFSYQYTIRFWSMLFYIINKPMCGHLMGAISRKLDSHYFLSLSLLVFTLMWA